ncbi:uncharacterized protein dbf4b [Hippocampus zosterae]|uniref:uncharacterized protein dbf4b n=1 Tax=Hippocampus zosterae TaxID=109293 RepID=UPI00223E3DB4|nr:uncharacterized protein dbf4b [Hippocampus zosterae]
MLQQCAEQPGLLGKLHPGEKKLEGKTFYLDNVKKRLAALLLEAIAVLGGSVESFLHRDVSFVVTGRQVGLEEKKLAGSGRSDEPRRPVQQREGGLNDGGKRRPGTLRPAACGSRGKALLEKAIRNNERLQASNVLSNARSWGVSIVHADDVLIYLKKLNRECALVRPSRAERTSSRQPSCRGVKAAPLRSPFLKIEDVSRKYKPLHVQSMSFPSLCYLGRVSPFEPPPPTRLEKTAKRSGPKSKVECGSEDKSQSLSPWPPRKKNVSYCECCLQAFANLAEHLRSDRHRAFAAESSNYAALEHLVLKMVPAFDLGSSEQADEVPNRPPDAAPVPAHCELVHLTDAEMEREVGALKRRSSSSIPALNSSPLRSRKSPDRMDPVPNPTPKSADIQCPKADDLARTATGPFPVFNTAPQGLSPLPPSPRPAAQDPAFDPYSVPPVLSPQVFTPDDAETRSLYSEPPVLSPQYYDGETGTSQSGSESLPISSLTFPSALASGPEEAKGSRPCPTEPPRCLKQSPNPDKRPRCSSCDRNRSKRKRKDGEDISESESRVFTREEWRLSQMTSVVQEGKSNANASQTASGALARDGRPVSPFKLLGHGVETGWSPASKTPLRFFGQNSQQSTSVRIDPALIPDVGRLSPSSSESDWDRELPSGPGHAAAAAADLDTDFIHRPCAWMSDGSYESRLHSALRPATPAMQPSTFSRTLVQIVEVLH